MITYNGNRYYFDAAVALMDDESAKRKPNSVGRTGIFDEHCEGI